MRYLLAMDWTAIFAGSAVTALLAFVTYLFKWWRFSPKDKSDIQKDHAIIQKMGAEATEIEAKAEVSLADMAMKIVQDLRSENQLTKQRLEHTETELNKSVDLCRTLTGQLEELRRELEKERSKNAEMTTRITELIERITKLQAESNK